jgi:DNA-binding CsgD family transcriptional regulator
MRTVMQSVFGCRELWADPSAWQAHLMQRACALAGTRVGLYFEMADHADKFANRVLSANDIGWESASERRTVVEALSQRPLRYSPLWAAFADRLPAHRNTFTGLTARQGRVIVAADWWSSEMYDRHVRPTRLGEALLSAVWVPRLQSWNAWSLVTDRGDAAPSPRNERLVRLLHHQLAPFIGTELATWRDRNASDLSDTRRRVLQALLDGHSEPDIARQAYRSRSAVHEHVSAIYRHFGVGSRGELAAYFLRRRPTAADKANTPSANLWLDKPWLDKKRS